MMYTPKKDGPSVALTVIILVILVLLVLVLVLVLLMSRVWLGKHQTNSLSCVVIMSSVLLVNHQTYSFFLYLVSAPAFADHKRHTKIWCLV